MRHFRGSKHTLTPPTYFQGSRPPTSRIYIPVNYINREQLSESDRGAKIISADDWRTSITINSINVHNRKLIYAGFSNKPQICPTYSYDHASLVSVVL